MSSRPELSQGVSDLKILEKGEPDKDSNNRGSSDPGSLEKGEPYKLQEQRRKKKDKLDKDLNLILVIVALLSAVVVTLMTYIQPQLNQDPNDEMTALLRILVYNANNSAFGGDVPQIPQWTGAPSALITSEYILFIALCTGLFGGAYALLIRLASVLNSWRFFHWLYYKLSPFVIWITIFLLMCAFGLIGLAATLQLPVVVDSYHKRLVPSALTT